MMGRREPRVGWGRYCVFSGKELHELKAHTLISVQLALPPGTCWEPGEHSQGYEKEAHPPCVA